MGIEKYATYRTRKFFGSYFDAVDCNGKTETYYICFFDGCWHLMFADPFSCTDLVEENSSSDLVDLLTVEFSEQNGWGPVYNDQSDE